jgi:hypothetical protein
VVKDTVSEPVANSNESKSATRAVTP